MLDVIISLLVTHTAPNALPATTLAPAIIEVSRKYNVDPILVTQIILQESKGVPTDYNPVSHDFGLMQINRTTAISLGISPKCLIDWRCNLDKGVAMIGQLARFSGFRACHYNTGRKGANRAPAACTKYENALARFKPKPIAAHIPKDPNMYQFTKAAVKWTK